MKLLSFIALAICAILCNPSIAIAQTTVLEVGNESVSLSDFEHIYGKNNRDSIVTMEALDEYMDLFVKFKLKVMEAEALGMGDAPEFISELAGYRKQLARPYLIDVDLLDELVIQAFERQQEEIRASHILISVAPNSEPADTLRAYNRCVKLRDRVLGGEDFSLVAKARDGSDDPSAHDNGGDLGWFTAFQMVYPFEEAAYNTPVGELSEIVRTKYGFHFLQVVDRRDTRGEIQVAHIMIRVADLNNKTMTQSAKAEIDAVAGFLNAGESFESLAFKYSDDTSSASKGGVLAWFGAGKMVEEFENAAFNLENNGDISLPFLSSYGWHIVKRIGYKAPQDFDSVKRALKKKVGRDARADVTRSSFLNKLKVEYNFSLNNDRVLALQKAVDKTDSVFTKGHPISHLSSAELKKTLFSIGDESTTVKEFVDFATSIKPRGGDIAPRESLAKLLNKFIEEELMEYEDARLEGKHDAFRLLIEEYHDGILLFELTDKMVWSKAVKDTTGLMNFHNENAAMFIWDDRLNIDVFTCEDEEIASEVKRILQNGGSIPDYRRELISEKPLAIRVETGMFPQGVNTWSDTVFSMIASGEIEVLKDTWLISLIETDSDAVVVVNIKGLVPPTEKSLDEARGQIIATFQDHLERVWLEELRNKYPVKVNYEVLYGLID
jgi:peptidyl-prolyl cis-trans isomerase SurA